MLKASEKKASVDGQALAPEARCLTERQTAQVLGCSTALLRKWRRIGKGPSFVRLVQRLVRYRLADLEGWLNSQEKLTTNQKRLGKGEHV